MAVVTPKLLGTAGSIFTQQISHLSNCHDSCNFLAIDGLSDISHGAVKVRHKLKLCTSALNGAFNSRMVSHTIAICIDFIIIHNAEGC